MARPRKHDRPDVVKSVCVAIAGGKLVKDACSEAGVTPKALREWCAEDAEFSALYARAREEQAHAIAEQAIAIAHGNDADNEARITQMVEAVHGADEDDKMKVLNALLRESVQRDRLRVDTLKWMASKIAPRTYGEKLEVAGAGGGPLTIRVVKE